MVGSKPEASHERLSRRAEFAAQFNISFRVFWLIAAGITRDRTLADDVVQDAAVVGIEKLDQFTPGTNFAAWMGQIVRNLALNRARGERRRRHIVLSAEMAADQLPSQTAPATVESPAVHNEGDDTTVFDRRVLQALDGLGDVPRACLLLRTVEGMGYAEISRWLGIPEGTAMSHVHRARNLLRRQLSDAGMKAGELPERSTLRPPESSASK